MYSSWNTNIKKDDVKVTPCSVSLPIRQSPYNKGYLTQHQKSKIQGLAYIIFEEFFMYLEKQPFSASKMEK